MTYYIAALENTRARLIESETRTTSKYIMEAVKKEYESRGFIVIIRVEE